ncbi:MAG TPA: hypothetical protein VEI98_12355 [Xanthobacteraceae bacterium]|nr:hypothetical protein [Xanthobacteraceae bacterium]
MKEYDFYESAVVRMLDHHRFPPPWAIEETGACFLVRDRNGQAIAHVYCEDNPTANLLKREEARQIATKVATLSLRASSQVGLGIKHEGRHL